MEEVEKIHENVTSPIPTPVTMEASAAPRPKMFDLVKEGWQFATARLDLIKWYLVSMMALAAVGSEQVVEQGGIIAFFAFLALIVIVVYVALNTWTVVHAVSQPELSKTTFNASFGWAAKNFFPLVWTSILSGLAVIVGTLFLIIPGIALSIYLYFSIYAQAHGAKAGMSALKQSYRDVKGRWWETFGQLLLLSFFLFLLFLVAAAVYGVLFAILGENEVVLFILDVLLTGTFGGVLGVVSMYSIGQYYKWLRETQKTHS